MVPSPRSRVFRPVTALLVLVLSVCATALAFALGPSEATTGSGRGATLPDGSQSQRVSELREALPGGDTAAALVVFSRTDGSPLSAAERAAVAAKAPALAARGLPGPPPVADVDPSGRLATVLVLQDADLEDAELADAVDGLRDTARADLPAGVRAEVTGGPAFEADLSAVFDGADVTLLAVTAGVVALLLLVTYRSPVLWIVPLVVVAVGDRLAGVLVGAVAPSAGVVVDPSSAGILSVLVFGAGTNYALLLVSRYRDELRREADRYRAMRRALGATAPAVLASGTTVVLSLLTLLAADLAGNRGLGFACALGVVVAMVFGLVVLPAALVLPGRWLFWPLVPRVGDPLTAEREGLWTRLGRAVARRPAVVAVAGGAVLLLLSLGAVGAPTGLSQNEQFRATPEAVRGAQTLASVLPAGETAPLTVVSTPQAAAAVAAAAREVDGVAEVGPARVGEAYASTSVVLTAAPGTDASDRALGDLRSALADVDGAEALVGGATAEAYDTARAYAADTRLVVPLVLAIVFGVLVALLRALVAPLLLVATVVASYFAALGGSWLVFREVYGFPALDVSVPLLSFLFLVALGVDYNIFLIARTREDVLTGHPTREAVLRALASTGGVITSAGILLAAVFAVLGVLPLITLTQIGVIVGVGVLLDTLLVRTVVVPALVLLTGRTFWWPSRPEPALTTGRPTSGHRERESARTG